RLPGGPLSLIRSVRRESTGRISGSWPQGRAPPWRDGGPGSTPGGSIIDHAWKVAGYGWPGRSAKAVSPRGMRVQVPCLPLACPDGEEDDHASVLTRSPGFESWSGHSE